VTTLERGEAFEPSHAQLGRFQALLIGAAIIAIACALLPVVAYAYTGYFTRYLADDYCVAAHMDDRGLWGSQVFWFTTWTGRFGAVFTIDFITFLGESAVPYWAIFIIGVWLALLVYACYQIGRVLFGRGLLIQSVLVATVLLFCFLKLIPSRDDGLYWLSGGTNYITPLVLLTLNAALLARAIATPGTNMLLASIAALVLGFIASGFAETFIIWQLTVLCLTLLLAWRFGAGTARERTIALAARALVGALIAANIVQFASGNQNRETTTTRAPLLDTALSALGDSIKFLPDLLLRPETLLAFGTVLAVTALLLLDRPERRPLKGREPIARLGLAFGILCLLVLATFAPGRFFLSTEPPERAHVSAVLSVVVFAMYAGYLGGRVLAARIAADESLRARLTRALPGLAVASALLVAAFTLPPAVREFGMIDERAAYARAWDERDRMLEEAGQAPQAHRSVNVTVPLIRHPGGFPYELRPNAEQWMNQCAAGYYSVRTITALPAQ
jgi:hypothetical protein